jgi:hypothetical protein
MSQTSLPAAVNGANDLLTARCNSGNRGAQATCVPILRSCILGISRFERRALPLCIMTRIKGRAVITLGSGHSRSPAKGSTRGGSVTEGPVQETRRRSVRAEFCGRTFQQCQSPCRDGLEADFLACVSSTR